MKLYYIHEEGNETGPFTTDELKGRNISSSTPVWHEGLPGWATAGEMPELSTLLKKTTPPPFKPVFATAADNAGDIANMDYQSAMDTYFSGNSSRSGRRNWIIAGLLLIVTVIFLFMYRQSQSNAIIRDLNVQLTDKQVKEAEQIRLVEVENQKRAAFRKDWDRYITKSNQRPKIDFTFGGISSFNTTITNGSRYMLEEVELTVKYIRKNGDVWQQKKLSFTNIAPGSQETMVAPSSANGVSIEMDITKVISKEMQFCYPHGRGPASDPYICK